ncbi:MAG: glycosyltransferase [Magnetococcales bacterium]|nr:TIGR04283 family arsenosugar biosynthesis glycosyltransferase [Magnetococcales bacterium]NGZ05325.1 glycosyltransferase [Magnetococcales bacterium]
MTAPTLSIIIPTCNEINTLPHLIAQLRQQIGVEPEIVIADGCSTDGTPEWARSEGIRVVACPQRGRGAQMNAGAHASTGSELLFLHADSGMPDITLLQQAMHCMQTYRLAGQKHCAGHFSIRFIDTAGTWHPLLRYLEKKSLLNRPECIHGDRGMWLSRSFFFELGGFRTDLPFLEDQQIAHRVAQQGQWTTLPGCLETSARRFRQEGTLKRTLLNAMILTAFQADFQEFLQQAPALYRTQEHTTNVQLIPFLRLVHQLDQAAGWQHAWHRWHRIGQSLCASFWQFFFMFDLLANTLRTEDRFPAILFHDRTIQPLLKRLPCAWIPAILIRYILILIETPFAFARYAC